VSVLDRLLGVNVMRFVCVICISSRILLVLCIGRQEVLHLEYQGM